MEQEKRRMEVQWNKQKQRIGKQAFMQVRSEVCSVGWSCEGMEEGSFKVIKTPHRNVTLTVIFQNISCLTLTLYSYQVLVCG